MSFRRTVIVTALMVLAAFVCRHVSHIEDVRPTKNLAFLPLQIGEWSGKETRFDPKVYEQLGVDDSFLANFKRSDGNAINLYVGYYESQKKGDLIHSPKNCMPGAGWGIIDTSVEEITINKNNVHTINAIKLTLQKGEKQQIVLYWFQSRGRFIASEYMQKIYLVADSITKRRTDGSFVRLTTPVVARGDEATIERMKEFASLLVPILQDYLPS
jgi:EpsI family protein